MHFNIHYEKRLLISKKNHSATEKVSNYKAQSQMKANILMKNLIKPVARDIN